MITRELDCVADSLKSNQAVQWEDVCYSAEYSAPHPYYASSERGEKVQKALDLEELNRKSEPFREQSLKDQTQGETEIFDDTFIAQDEDIETLPDRPFELGEEEEEKEEKEAVSPMFSRKNPLVDLDFDTELSYIRYTEPGLMRQKGVYWGVRTVYTYRLRENKIIKSFGETFSDDSNINMLRFDGRIVWGEVDYKSTNTGEVKGENDYMFELRGIAGYDLPQSKTFLITPYGGLGYRYLNNDSGGMRSTTGHYGYEREANYLYMPLGFETMKHFKNKWSLGIMAEYDLFLGGIQKSHLQDVDRGLKQLENEQEDGFGLKGALKILKKDEHCDIFFETFVNYWNIDDSRASSVTYSGFVIGAGIEPENTSKEYGIRLGARF